MVFFALRVSVQQKIGKSFVMVCCPNPKIWLANNLTSPFPSYVSCLTRKNACFLPQTCLSVFAVENGVSRSCTFRFVSDVFKLPTVLSCGMVVVFIENIQLIS